MAYPFEYKPNYIKDKTLYSIEKLKEVLNLKHDMIQVPRHGRMEMVKEQRGTCWLADDDLTFEYSGKSMIPQKIPDIIRGIKLQIERGYLSKWAMPDKINFVSEIEKTSVGKINKKFLRKQFN